MKDEKTSMVQNRNLLLRGPTRSIAIEEQLPSIVNEAAKNPAFKEAQCAAQPRIEPL